MMRESTVSAPTFVALNVNVPYLFIVLPMTELPIFLWTGIDSPVIIDSSISDSPSVIAPSTGIRSPGRTTTKSPTRTSAMDTSTSFPSRTIFAVFG